PVSISLQSPQGLNLSYDLSSNAVSNGLGSAFVSVGGNVEMVVMENAAGTFNLDVANVASTAQGGAVRVSANGFSSEEFTAGLQGGETAFQLALGGESGAVSSSVSSALATPAGATAVALLTGLVTFQQGTNAAVSTESSEAATSAAAVGGSNGVG